MTRSGRSPIPENMPIKPLYSLSLIAIFVAATSYCAAAGRYQFAGISAKSTFAEIRGRYPNSTFSDGYVRVSDSDSHDRIHSISVSEQRVRVNFQEATCSSVAKSLVKGNGEVSQTYDFYEETLPSKRFIWKSDGETMMLQCHEKGGRFWAQAVSFFEN